MPPEVIPTRELNTDAQVKEKRVLRVDRYWSRKDRQWHYSKTAKENSQRDSFRKYVLVVRRIIYLKGVVHRVDIEIRSEKLAQLLAKILDGVSGLELARDPALIDPEILFHTRPALTDHLRKEQEKGEDSDKELIGCIKTALGYINEEYGSTTANLSSLFKQGYITYDLLWALFKPNSVIYTESNLLREPQAVKFNSSEYVESPERGKWFQIEAKMIHSDGDEFGWGCPVLKIPLFEGGKKISNLVAYPLEFHSESDKVRSLLLQRGRKYVNIVNNPTCKEYNGLAVYQNQILDKLMEVRFSASGRIMVDPVTFRSKNLNASNLLEPDVYAGNSVDLALLSDDDLILCDHRVQGFAFTQKRWGAFAVSRMSDVVWNETAFDKLILEDKKRRMIRLLVSSHRNDEESFDDIVNGKGKGLVGLLSGSPGVGKTLTAEVVAELSQRPLYTVSAGELGTTVTHVDDQLGMVLDISRRWGCVLLIDEADVFLHKRGEAELERNALVSVFLRRLEYFQGIVILTTNRRKDIDEAFESRIHFKFHYQPLDADDRLKIWKNALYSVDIAGLRLGDKDLIELAKRPLNGREIKNTVSCAVSIVRAGEEIFTLEFVKEILESLIEDDDQDEN